MIVNPQMMLGIAVLILCILLVLVLLGTSVILTLNSINKNLHKFLRLYMYDKSVSDTTETRSE
jgi:hypothetical protein